MKFIRTCAIALWLWIKIAAVLAAYLAGCCWWTLFDPEFRDEVHN